MRHAQRERARPAVKRLGKTRGAILDVLDASGGAATLGEIAASLHRKRPRDLRRRLLPLLEGAGILTVEADLVTLADDWLEALEAARELGGELAAEEADRQDIQRRREAYHRRHEVYPDHHPANAEADGWVEELRPPAALDEGAETSTEELAPLSTLAVAIDAYLQRAPRDADQPPGWLGVTVWAEGMHPKLENPAIEAKVALEELGGERYRRELLERARAA